MSVTLPEYLCNFTFGMLFAAQIFCTATMYLKGKTHGLQKAVFWFMAYLLAISTVELVAFPLAGAYSFLTSPVTDILEMTVVPAALLLFQRIVEPERKTVWILIANSLLYAAALTSYCITDNAFIYRAILVFTILYSVFIISYGFVATRRYNLMLKDNFSDDALSLYWLKYILCVYAAIICLWTWASLSGTPYAVAIYDLGMMVLLGLLCYFSYRQDDMLEALEALSPDENGKSPAPKNRDFEERLKKLFSEDEIYLDPKLTINDLARALRTNRTYASNFLNSQMHTSFYEYVNGWRVEKAKSLLSTTQLPLETVAEKSGFNSISSFRRYFSAAYGIAPSVYRKKGAQ